MALAPRPTWEPIPHPPGPDPATAQDFAVLAAGEMAPLEDAALWMSLGLAALDSGRVEHEVALDVLALDIGAGAVELDAMGKESACDPTAAKLIKAAEQDAALDAAGLAAVPAWPEA